MIQLRNLCFLLLIGSILCLSCRVNTRERAKEQEVKITVVRYDKLLNDYVRSNSFSALQKMNMEYPQITKVLIEDVLVIGQVNDDTISQKLKQFYSDTTLLRVMADVEAKYPNLDELEKELTKGFRKLKKEVPSIQLPQIYTQVSAFNESVVLTDSLLGISLDKYMGEDYPVYKRFYYDYQRRSMKPERIVPDCIIFYLLGQYSFVFTDGVSLVDMMIHSGKINYVAQQLLGYRSIGEMIGYSEKEQQWCKTNEKRVWEYMLNNNQLHARDPMVVRSYLRLAPYVNTFGKDTPPLLGIWIGGRIVSSYMKHHKETTLKELLEMTDYKRMLAEASFTP